MTNLDEIAKDLDSTIEALKEVKRLMIEMNNEMQEGLMELEQERADDIRKGLREDGVVV